MSRGTFIPSGRTTSVNKLRTRHNSLRGRRLPHKQVFWLVPPWKYINIWGVWEVRRQLDLEKEKLEKRPTKCGSEATEWGVVGGMNCVETESRDERLAWVVGDDRSRCRSGGERNVRRGASKRENETHGFFSPVGRSDWVFSVGTSSRYQCQPQDKKAQRAKGKLFGLAGHRVVKVGWNVFHCSLSFLPLLHSSFLVIPWTVLPRPPSPSPFFSPRSSRVRAKPKKSPHRPPSYFFCPPNVFFQTNRKRKMSLEIASLKKTPDQETPPLFTWLPAFQSTNTANRCPLISVANSFSPIRVRFLDRSLSTSADFQVTSNITSIRSRNPRAMSLSIC